MQLVSSLTTELLNSFFSYPSHPLNTQKSTMCIDSVMCHTVGKALARSFEGVLKTKAKINYRHKEGGKQGGSMNVDQNHDWETASCGFLMQILFMSDLLSAQNLISQYCVRYYGIAQGHIRKMHLIYMNWCLAIIKWAGGVAGTSFWGDWWGCILWMRTRFFSACTFQWSKAGLPTCKHRCHITPSISVSIGTMYRSELPNSGFCGLPQEGHQTHQPLVHFFSSCNDRLYIWLHCCLPWLSWHLPPNPE